MTTATYTYDDADQLLSDGTSSYSHDALGNMTAAGSDSFSWDWSNRLSSATVNSTTVAYTYDGDDVRTSATSGGVTTPYLWDRESGLPLLVDDGDNAYLHADGLVSEIDTTTTSYYLTDGLGSVRGLTDSGGTLTGTSDYAVFGAMRTQTGASSVFGFTGEQHDPVTGFTHLRARDLNPALGRFLSVDTVQPNAPGTQGYNVYAYVANNPTTWADPSGHVVAPVLAANWLPIALAAAAILIMDCAANSPLGLCSWFAAFIITIFTIVACLLDMDGLCWRDGPVELERQNWTRDTLPESPNDYPEVPYDPCAEEDKLGNSLHDDLLETFDREWERAKCIVSCVNNLPVVGNEWVFITCSTISPLACSRIKEACVVLAACFVLYLPAAGYCVNECQ